ncbi:uncharacterized protein LOC128675127 [Plodia interpunctella]|uniref:uncharacterized protein LOC128675127 n=1 Tax=Plodia interpunctella TaxID=58824 RepID=UPI002368927E|nr:uncharacterized protein LOC128675127 [Plodia interpunctella]
MSDDEVVIINDGIENDSDIEIVDISKETSTELKSPKDGTIIIDDENVQNENDVIEIIDIDRDANDKCVKEYLNKVCSENKMLGEFIEKCLDIENTSGMLRVIHRTFLPLYFKLDDTYRENDFKKLIDMTTRALEVNPLRKFSHLKNVCEVMKCFAKDRKKVNFVTLTTDIKAKPSPRKPQKRKHKTSVSKKNNKKVKRKTKEVIVVEDVDESATNTSIDNETPANNNSMETSDVVILDELELPNNSNKENNICSNNNEMSTQDSNSEVNTSEFLVPHKSEEYIMREKKALRIKYIEKQIEWYKAKIDVLEQQEVDWDSFNSPYVVSEELKSMIVKLYEELCTLTGCEAVKKREVRFTAVEGRPQLPVKLLEEFINENISSDGHPHFPDFTEVVKCVTKANADAKLGWSQPQIMAEARNLFTYCGQALQENRKKREWRYLLSRINSQLDTDPAENDPILMQRLEVNRRIAVKKEADLLDKYVELEQITNSNSQITPFRVAQGASDDEDNNELETQTTNKEITTLNHNFNNLTNCNNETGNKQCRPEIITSKSIVYGNHRTNTDDMHETNILDQKNNVESNETLNAPKFIEISVPAINTAENEKSADAAALENKQNDKRMIEVYVENNKPPEVKLINVSSIDTNESSLPLETKETRIETGIKELVQIEAVFDSAGNDKVIDDDCTMNTGNIVIKDVYSIETKQEVTSLQNNDWDKDNSDVANRIIEKNMQEYSNNQGEYTEENENISVNKDIVPVTVLNTINCDTEKSNAFTTLEKNVHKDYNNHTNQGKFAVETAQNNETTSCDHVNSDVNNDILQTVKVESSDVLNHMQKFGDSFSATIFDIEDPFLVIEISDSSDDSDCDMEVLDM